MSDLRRQLHGQALQDILTAQAHNEAERPACLAAGQARCAHEWGTSALSDSQKQLNLLQRIAHFVKTKALHLYDDVMLMSLNAVPPEVIARMNKDDKGRL